MTIEEKLDRLNELREQRKKLDEEIEALSYELTQFASEIRRTLGVKEKES